VLGDPRGLVEERAAEVDELRDRARRTLDHRLERAADDIAHQRARARALSPLATLERGYAVLQDADGHVVTSVTRVQPKAKISVRVADGRVHATTTRTEPLEGADG
jgi:exodeoxyribonuclease VII large subunit